VKHNQDFGNLAVGGKIPPNTVGPGGPRGPPPPFLPA
jgi:hypothetical protein